MYILVQLGRAEILETTFSDIYVIPGDIPLNCHSNIKGLFEVLGWLLELLIWLCIFPKLTLILWCVPASVGSNCSLPLAALSPRLEIAFKQSNAKPQTYKMHKNNVVIIIITDQSKLATLIATLITSCPLSP